MHHSLCSTDQRWAWHNNRTICIVSRITTFAIRTCTRARSNDTADSLMRNFVDYGWTWHLSQNLGDSTVRTRKDRTVITALNAVVINLSITMSKHRPTWEDEKLCTLVSWSRSCCRNRKRHIYLSTQQSTLLSLNGTSQDDCITLKSIQDAIASPTNIARLDARTGCQ